MVMLVSQSVAARESPFTNRSDCVGLAVVSGNIWNINLTPIMIIIIITQISHSCFIAVDVVVDAAHLEV